MDTGPGPKRARTAADFIEETTPGVSIVIGDVIGHLASALEHWNQAASLVRSDPDRAQTHLIEAEIDLDIPLRLGRSGLLRTTRRGESLLELELPDDEDEPSN